MFQTIVNFWNDNVMMSKKIEYNCFHAQLSHSYSYDVNEVISLVDCQTVKPKAVWVPQQFQASHEQSVWEHRLYQCMGVPFWCCQVTRTNEDSLWNYNGRCKCGLRIVREHGICFGSFFSKYLSRW